MKTTTTENYELTDRKFKILVVLALLTAGLLCYRASADDALSAPAGLPPNAQEVVKLSKAHLGDDVILAYLRSSAASYNLSANDILYLTSQGVSQPVIAALLQAQPAAVPPQAAPAPSVSAPPPANPVPASGAQVLPPGSVPPAGVAPPAPSTPLETPPPDSELSLSYFQNQLTPYGQWVYLPSYGQCWVPTVQSQVAGWRPYLNGGHWEYTDNGWFWASDYPWGEYVFHYGRWMQMAPYGWVWVPGYHWGPGWVCWRDVNAEGFCGWAPLPPGAVFVPGVGLQWNGHLNADVDFGLGPDLFVFVPFDHFWKRDYVPFVAPGWRVPGLFRASVVINGYGFVGGRFVIGGLGRARIGLFTHYEVPLFSVGFHDDRIAHDHERAFGRPVGRGFGRGFDDHHRR